MFFSAHQIILPLFSEFAQLCHKIHPPMLSVYRAECLADATSATATLALAVNVHIANFAADIRLVRLDLAGKFFQRAVMQSQADTLFQKPCAFLRDAQCAVQFVRTDSIFRAGDEPYSKQPFVQTNTSTIVQVSRRLFKNARLRPSRFFS